jgi:hypothetical protein
LGVTPCASPQLQHDDSASSAGAKRILASAAIDGHRASLGGSIYVSPDPRHEIPSLASTDSGSASATMDDHAPSLVATHHTSCQLQHDSTFVAGHRKSLGAIHCARPSCHHHNSLPH